MQKPRFYCMYCGRQPLTVKWKLFKTYHCQCPSCGKKYPITIYTSQRAFDRVTRKAAAK